MSYFINFNELGGYRLEQPTLKKMQETNYQFLKAMIGHFGIPDEGSFIISGCNIIGQNITPGMLYINGNLCWFNGGQGQASTKIAKVIHTETLGFQNGTSPIIFTRYTAEINNDGTPLSDYIRVPSPISLPEGIVIDPNYIAFTQSLLQKLNGIEAGAEKNVQTDWDEQNPQSDRFLVNKPLIPNFLFKGKALLGDIINTDYDVLFSSPLTTSNYDVFFSFETTQNNAGQTASIIGVVHSKTVNGFKIRMAETGNNSQNLTITYLIIRN